ncbi:protein tyrosine phosphatase [Cohnella endophytica]|uniref:Tyrosine-protein phosphatase n=1 Tax=Cohnella endophytica TaxID=2419778 RepID=A0A494XVG5_9BACL|nr:CpsB/CapC family capsule biosynthesis tyrosine phosphatase [Cohnella endophytica]RKP53835.1 protein tyrosine phosphatase [Cohnella endophytica]
MIDIHTHILPGIDDGADSWEATLNLARAAVSEGITTLIATPHHANGRYTNFASEVQELTRLANERLVASGIPLSIAPGQEIRVHEDLLDAWQRGELLSLAGSMYVLIEMPSNHIPTKMEELIHELRVMNLTPIIAHPERNAEIVKSSDRLARLVDRGACAQVTTHSLLGGFGKQIEKTAWSLCKSGLVHVISSDAHHPERRGFRLREAYEAIGRRMGEPWADYYFANAQCVADNRDFGMQPKVQVPSKSSISRLFSFFYRP